ncbi:MAG: hypothetical protein IGR92_10865 [Leptolyngbyaceae cyanobacterium T60_A2020_046]|nr:hypothetical protein [Leptolyngbyaceae cyanobacterium T60_A2020_046]
MGKRHPGDGIDTVDSERATCDRRTEYGNPQGSSPMRCYPGWRRSQWV